MLSIRVFFLLGTLFLFGWLLIACVTINVYFPAAAAEKAADQVIDKVWGRQSSTTTSSTSKEGPSTEPNFLDLQSKVNLDISSDTSKTLQANMEARHNKLKQYYKLGAIGLTNNALISLRQPAEVPLKKRRDVNRWIAEENQDRLNLYREIALINGHPEWSNNIRTIFAYRWKERALPGWWYQDKNDQWQVKSKK